MIGNRDADRHRIISHLFLIRDLGDFEDKIEDYLIWGEIRE
jgi:hypothetical protein